MGAITQKIYDLLNEGANIETSRSTGIILSSNYFDALDDDGQGTTGVDKKEGGRTNAADEGEQKKKPDLNDIPQ
jgi:hypothetical protein